MDLIKIAFEKMGKGSVKTLHGLIVIRIGDRYIVGESPSIRETGDTLDAAVEKFMTLSRAAR